MSMETHGEMLTLLHMVSQLSMSIGTHGEMLTLSHMVSQLSYVIRTHGEMLTLSHMVSQLSYVYGNSWRDANPLTHGLTTFLCLWELIERC